MNFRVSVVENKSPPRKRGRPREFDRATALAAAARTFWRLGYEGASIADLTATMGITPQSLYSAFGSKADLYRESLAWYQGHVGVFVRKALEEEPSVIAAFARMLKEAAQEYTRQGALRGCMLSTALLGCAEEHEAVAEHVAAMRSATLTAVQARIERGIADGELRRDTYARGLARYIAAIIQGMSVQAQDGADETELQAVAELAMAALRRHRV